MGGRGRELSKSELTMRMGHSILPRTSSVDLAVS